MPNKLTSAFFARHSVTVARDLIGCKLYTPIGGGTIIETEAKNYGAAVLIRAIQPEQGLEALQTNRPVKDLRQLCNGPGKLCQAFNLGQAQDGLPLGRVLWIEAADRP